MSIASEHRVAASFDRAAATYLASARVQEELARWLAEWIPDRRGGRALEVGAGPGVLTRLLLQGSGELVASDLSEAMRAAGQRSLPQIRWLRLPAENPAGGPWDWIFSSSLLQWAADPPKLFAAWRSHLAPGGRVLSALFAEGSLREWSELAGSAPPLQWRKPEEWRALLERAGLNVVRDSFEARSIVYPSALELLRSLHGAGAAPARRIVPGRLRRLMREYESRHAVDSGVTATWMFYRFEAAKAR